MRRDRDDDWEKHARLQLDSINSSEGEFRCALFGQISRTREKSCETAFAGWWSYQRVGSRRRNSKHGYNRTNAKITGSLRRMKQYVKKYCSDWVIIVSLRGEDVYNQWCLFIEKTIDVVPSSGLKRTKKHDVASQEHSNHALAGSRPPWRKSSSNPM